MNTPKIRFKGFTDDWEQRKLGDVFEQTTNFVDPNKKEIELWSLTVEDGLTPKSERYNREFLVKKDTGFKEVRSGDIVYNPMNMTLGAVGYNGMSKSVAVSGYYTTMITNEGYDSYYINTWLKSPQAMALYKTFATGSLIEKQRVQFPTLSIIPATFPQYEEQVRIGYYFMRLDHLITLHQRKCDETKQLKKFMLQKMFPKNGEKNPEIRFEGFTDDWEQRKLGDSCKLNGRIGFRGYTEKDIVTKEIGGVLTFSPTNIVDNKLTMECKNTYITREKYDESPEIKIFNGDILFVKTGSTLGKSALVTGLKEDASINPQIVVMRVEKDKETFMSNVLITDGIKKQVTAVKIGGAVPTMTETELKNIKYYEPVEKEEQKRIGQYFEHLDHLITLHQRKCEKLKELKKYMLQNMFV